MHPLYWVGQENEYLGPRVTTSVPDKYGNEGVALNLHPSTVVFYTTLQAQEPRGPELKKKNGDLEEIVARVKRIN